jgi:hypothetical protein
MCYGEISQSPMEAKWCVSPKKKMTLWFVWLLPRESNKEINNPTCHLNSPLAMQKCCVENGSGIGRS